MKDISQMSDAELEAIANGGEQSQDLSHLSDDELHAIANGQTPSAPSNKLHVPEGADVDKYLAAQGFNVQEAANPSLDVVGPLKSTVAGAVQGASLGSADEIYGAAKAAGQVIGDQTFTNFNANRRHYTDVAREQFDQLKAANPDSFNIGEIAGSVGTGLATGGASSVSGAIASGAGLTAVQTYFTSADPSAREVMSSALFGGALGAAGPALGKVGEGLKYAGERLGISQALGGITTSMNKTMNSWITKNASSKEEVASLLLDKTLSNGDRLIVPGQAAEVTLDNLRVAKNESGQQMGGFLKGIEAQLGPDLTTVMGNKIMPRVDELTADIMSKTGDPTLANEMNSVRNWAQINFKDQTFSLSELNRKIGFLNNQLYNVSTADNIQKKQIVGYARNLLNDTLDSLPEVAGSAQLKMLKKEYGLYSELEDQVVKNVDRQSSIFSPVKDGLLGIGATVATGNPALGAAAVMTRMAVNSDAFQGAAGTTLRRLGDNFQRNPDKWGKYAQGLALAANGTYRQFDDEMAYVDAQMSLQGNPVQRNTQDMLAKKDKIMSVLYKTDSQSASMLGQALDSYDYGTANMLMDKISKDPRYSYIIEKGQGWNGQLFDPADKAQIQQDVISGPNSKQLSTAQKLDAINSLKQGQLPQLNKPAPVPRALRQVIHRDASGKKIEPY